MNGVDWFYEIGLPVHFMVEHPLGCVLGRAVYGDFLFFMQGVTVGGNRSGVYKEKDVLVSCADIIGGGMLPYDWELCDILFQ